MAGIQPLKTGPAKRKNFTAIGTIVNSQFKSSNELASMRYRLRTLLILLAVGPLTLAAGWWMYSAWE